MYLADEVFVEEISQRGWVDRVLANAALAAFQNKVGQHPDLHVWDILISQSMITSEQAMEIRKDWQGGSLPIFDGYQLVRLVGKGSMGHVYEALQLKLDRKVALKILTKEAGSNFEFLTRFRQEAKAAAVLNHPNIVQAFDVGESLGFQYMVMEFVPGKTVRQILKETGTYLNVQQALEVVQQICLALDHSSGHKIIHRDIRPDNILISEEGLAKLTDFALVKQLGGGKGTLSLTMAGSIIGDPYYISPEQSMGDSNTDIDIRSDIYSLGISLYEMLTNRLPFSGTSPIEVISQHLNAEPPQVSLFRQDLLPGVDAIVHKMMDKSPRDRYQTPMEVVSAIEGLLGVPAPKHGTVRFTKSFYAKAVAGPGGPAQPSSPAGSYYIANRQVMFGTPPAGVSPLPDIFDYFLKVCEKLGGVLHLSVQNIPLFASLSKKNKELIQEMKQAGKEDLSSIKEMLINYRQFYGLTLHPMVQGFLGPDLLKGVQPKISTYFSHLEAYFQNLGIAPELCKQSTITPDDALPVLQSLGMVAAPTPPAAPVQKPLDQVSPPPQDPQPDYSDMPTEDITDDLLEAAASPPPSSLHTRVSDTDAALKSLDSMLASEKENLPEVPPTQPSSKADDPLDFLGPEKETRGAAGLPHTTSSPHAAKPPVPSSAPTDRSSIDLDASLQSLLGEGIDSSRAAKRPSSPREPAPKASTPLPEPTDDDSGSWLLGDMVPASAPAPEAEEEDSGSWFLGDEASGLSFGGDPQDTGDEQVISLWGESDGQAKAPLKLIAYDPKKEAGGSSFIDVRYDVWYRNETTLQTREPVIEVRVKKGKGQRERYQEIYIRIKSFRDMDKSGDGKFIIILAKESPDDLSTWYDPSVRKKLVYNVDPKKIKGASPEDMMRHHPFETPDRDIDRIIKIALKNYSVTKR